MHTTNLRKVGGSVMLKVPPALLDILGLRVGARVDIAVENGRLIVEPSKRPSYSLEAISRHSATRPPVLTRIGRGSRRKPVGDELL